jgi:peroxiredoxin Q/BCP
LTEAGIAAVGISPDSPSKLGKFSSHHGLNFALLSDEDHSVSEAYGVWGEKKLYGRVFNGITRSSFLIDENGVILGAWYKVGPADTVPKALDALGIRK